MLPLPAKYFYAACSEYMRRKWQGEWESSSASKLQVVKPRLAPWASSSRMLRIEEVRLCRLRIGHTLAIHRYLLCGDPRPVCTRCGDHLSVSHVLVSCRCLVSERVRFFGSSRLTVKELLDDTSDHITEVFRFLNHVSFPVIFSPTL